MTTLIEQARLWQLISPLLPVGAYHHSQGLEQAVARGWVADEATAEAWIGGLLDHVVTNLDLPVVARARHAWRCADVVALQRWDAFGRACRESEELRAEERNMGDALTRLLGELGECVPAVRLGFAAAFGVAAANAALTERDALAGYAWAWCENQTAAAVKLVPLGHSAGQRMLRRITNGLDTVVANALDVADEDIGRMAPGLAIASARHESQHTRLFRS